ncbi:MAG TPA: hypothetical protein VN893_10420 [Bryobacteraceae bacterium]|jgi:hypothetical protein|nr:hypothetical protein [Bryobacteraceae bacterium]
MVSNLKLQNGSMIGTLAGKSVLCFVQATQGSEPPAGKYIVRGPIDDPVYGRVAILTMANVAGAGQAVTGWFTRPPAGATVSYDMQSPAVYQWIQQPPAGATAFNCFMPSGAVGMDDWTASGRGGAFLLSGRAIPGANCLVVTSGLNELMDALKLAGSAEIMIG